MIETVPESDGATVFLRTTFGVLVSRDAGKTWRWICERALGYEGTWDPPIAVTRDGRLWVGLEHGLVSTLDGCTVERSPELEGETIADLTTDPHGEVLWAITGRPDKRNAVWRRLPDSAKGKGSWERRGEAPEDIHLMTIEVAPSRPNRIYLTGQPYGTVRGQLFWSDDGGKTMAGDKNALAAEGPFFIAAVDPKDPNRVVLRHLHTTGSDVLVTIDKGKTFKNVLSMQSAMFGFAKSPDGRTYWAGSGLPEHGIFRSTDRGEHFERVSEHGVLCLHDAPGGRLFVCENPFKLGAPAVALSTDQGMTVEAIATFGDVQGPIACPSADAAADLCAGSWPETRASVLPRAADDGGVGSSPVDASLTDAGMEDRNVAPPSSRRSCGCHAVGAPSRLDPRWLTAGLAALFAGARARKPRGSERPQGGRPSPG